MAFSTAGLLLGMGGFAHSLHRAHQETLSKASKLNLEYGGKYRPMLSFFMEYKGDCARNSINYTDAFCKQAHDVDKQASKYRGSLEGFWKNVRCSCEVLLELTFGSCAACEGAAALY